MGRFEDDMWRFDDNITAICGVLMTILRRYVAFYRYQCIQQF
jgi:hypothetical protein